MVATFDEPEQRERSRRYLCLSCCTHNGFVMVGCIFSSQRGSGLYRLADGSYRFLLTAVDRR